MSVTVHLENPSYVAIRSQINLNSTGGLLASFSCHFVKISNSEVALIWVLNYFDIYFSWMLTVLHVFISLVGFLYLDKERVSNHDNIVTQYKEFIRVQDLELAELKQKVTGFDEMKTELEQLRQQVWEKGFPGVGRK